MIQKNFKLNVNEDFHISAVHAEDNSPAVLSQSEKVLSLASYVGALAKIAPTYKQATAQELWGTVGNIDSTNDSAFPMVIDAPLGVLGTEYEKSFIDALPNLLPQIIIPVTAKNTKNWLGIKESIGAVYVVPKRGSAIRENTFIEWDGGEYPYLIKDENVHKDQAKVIRIS